MKVARQNASCSVFEGRIVVTGGYNNNYGLFNTVEAYDHIDDSWTKMPNMNIRRHSHKSVAIRNRLFIIGDCFNQAIEVFDSCSNKFALLQHPPINMRNFYTAALTSIGNKVVVFSNRDGSVLFYDVEKDVWSKKSCVASKHIEYFFCATVPHWKVSENNGREDLNNEIV